MTLRRMIFLIFLFCIACVIFKKPILLIYAALPPLIEGDIHPEVFFDSFTIIGKLLGICDIAKSQHTRGINSLLFMMGFFSWIVAFLVLFVCTIERYYKLWIAAAVVFVVRIIFLIVSNINVEEFFYPFRLYFWLFDIDFPSEMTESQRNRDTGLSGVLGLMLFLLVSCVIVGIVMYLINLGFKLTAKEKKEFIHDWQI